MAAGERRRQQPTAKKAVAVATTETKALVALVGLPPAVVNAAEDWARDAFVQQVRVVSQPASRDDGKPYTTRQITTVVETIADFAHRKQRAERQPAPAAILLLYVPGPTADVMLAAFDFFAFPVPLTELSEFVDGRQLRHDPKAVKNAIETRLAPSSAVRVAQAAVADRIAALNDTEPLQLPPRNYLAPDGEPIADIFRTLRSGTRPWTYADFGLIVGEYDKKKIPHLRPEVRRRAFEDNRGLIFLRADANAFHGANREIDEEEEEVVLLRLLRGAYRFGSPLPSGFHHDVQLLHDKSLKNLRFQCDRKSRIYTKKGYVNIYPNDVVRGKKMTVL